MDVVGNGERVGRREIFWAETAMLLAETGDGCRSKPSLRVSEL